MDSPGPTVGAEGVGITVLLKGPAHAVWRMGM